MPYPLQYVPRRPLERQVYWVIFPAAMKDVWLYDSNSACAVGGQNLKGKDVVRATACVQLHG